MDVRPGQGAACGTGLAQRRLRPWQAPQWPVPAQRAQPSGGAPSAAQSGQAPEPAQSGQAGASVPQWTQLIDVVGKRPRQAGQLSSDTETASKRECLAWRRDSGP